MTQRAKVGVIVHNDVLRDARVRKQTRTLVEAGHDVEVVGLTKHWDGYPSHIEGARLRVLLNRHKQASAAIGAMVVALEAFLVVLILSVCAFSLASNDLTTQLVALLVGSTAGLLVMNAYQGRTARQRVWIRSGRVAYAATITLAGMVAIPVLSLRPEFPILIGFIFWAILRSGANVRNLRDVAHSGFINLLRRNRSAREYRWNQMATLLAENILESQYDIIHCHDLVALIAAGKIKRKRPNTKIIWDAHEIYEEVANGTEQDKELTRRLIRQNIKYVDGFVTISQSFKEFYSKNYGLKDAAIVMNATRHSGDVSYDGRLHEAARLVPERNILLFQGGFSFHRGIEDLMEAAADLPPNWSIVAMGWGALEQNLVETSAKLSQAAPEGHAPLVVIPPAAHDELAEWTAGATLGVIPYRNTGLNHLYCTPNKLWEFPNAGVPILATDLVEMSAMIRQWGTGYLLPREFSARDIIAVLQSITAEDIAAKKVKCAEFSKSMGWETFESALLGLYDRLLDAPSTLTSIRAAE